MSNYYRVYKNGAYMGETCAVSEKGAINNVRHREEGDYCSQYDENWSAILQDPEYILCSPRRCAKPDLTKDNFKGCYYTASYDGTDGLYLSALEESKKGKTCVLLLPVSTSTRLFHEVIKPNAKSIEFIRGRLKFERKGKDGKFYAKSCGQHDSMIVVFKE